MRLGNTEWPEDTEKIIKKNQLRDILKVVFPISGYLLFVLFFALKQYILAFILLVAGLIMIVLVPKKIKLAISDMLALDLYKLFINLALQKPFF